MNREALVVGINRYPLLKDKTTGKPRHLLKPAADAEAIAQFLEIYGNFRVQRLPALNIEEKWRVDPDPQPLNLIRVQDLKKAIANLFNPPSSTIADTALLFFAGHGLRTNEGGVREGFLATSEANPQRDKWGLSMHWLHQLLLESPVRQQIVWLDCCHSGELLNFAEIDPGSRGKAKDRCLIAASRDFEVAYEEVGGEHGILTSALLQALNPENQPEGWVTNYSLVDFINKQLKNTRQRPIFYNFGGEILLTGSKEKIDRAVLMLAVCPYKGLESFDFNDEDAKYFKGRTTLTGLLLDKVRESNFLAVIGASGSGKSSVVKAGLLYQLKTGQRLSGSDTWPIVICRPGETPLKNLASAFAKAEIPDIPPGKAEELIALGAVGLKELVVTAAGAGRLVLLVDQFEECFTLCQDIIERQKFFECILGALDQTNNQLCLVLAMRADFFGKCAEQEYAGLAQKIQENLVTVTPMNQEELEEAITEPARMVGLEIQRELVEEILSDVEGSPGILPLLQYTLTELWRRRQVDRLTLAEYIKLGGVKGTLPKRADEVYQSLSQAEQLTAKQIFLELTQLGEGTEDTRRQIFKVDLITENQPSELVDAVLSKLADARLVVTSQIAVRGENAIANGDTSPTVTVVDVAHEALIRHWPLLRQWVDENREVIRIERRIEMAAEEWQAKGKPEENAFLLVGPKLVEAEHYLQNYSYLGLLSSLGREFIQVSQAARDRILREEAERQQRELNLIAEKLQQETNARKAAQVRNWIAGISSIVLLILTAMAIRQAIDARIKTLYALASSAETLSVSNKKLDALVETIKGINLLKNSVGVSEDARILLLATWGKVVDEVEELNTFEGHSEWVLAVAYSPDGETIASASYDRTIKLWQPDGTPIKTLEGHQDWVQDVNFSPDGKILASVGGDGNIILWQKIEKPKTGNQPKSTDWTMLKKIPAHQDWIMGVSFSPDGQIIATASKDKTIKLWSRTGNLLRTLRGHKDRVLNVAFSPDGKTIASASRDKKIKLWSINGRLLQTLRGHSDVVSGVSFSPDGKRIVSSSLDRTLRLWSVNGELIKIMPGHEQGVESVSFSPDGKTIASASADQTIKLWHNDGTLIRTLRGHTHKAVDVTFSPDSKTIVSSSLDKTLKLWRTEGKFEGHKDAISRISFSPDRNNPIIATASLDGTVKIWSQDGNFIRNLEGHKSGVIDVKFSPDGQNIADSSDDKTVKLWSVNGKLIKTLAGHTDSVRSVNFSPDGQMIASASTDKTIKLWHLNGQLIRTFQGHKDWVNNVSFSPDGQMIASASTDETVKLWNVNGSLLLTLPGHKDGAFHVIFSPDGKMMATASTDEVKLWDLKGKLLRKLQLGSNNTIMNISFMNKGQMIALVTNDKKMKIWDINGKLLQKIQGNNDSILNVSFSNDGRKIALVNAENTVSLWDLEMDKLLNKGCNLLDNYLKTNKNVLDLDREVCRELGSNN